MDCYLYVRVSTDDQVDGFSIEAQLRAGHAKAAAMGYTVAGVFQDLGESAKTSKRHEFQRMMQLIRQASKPRRVKAIIIDNLDRFMRNLRELLNFHHELKQLGVRLLSATEDIDTESETGKFLFHIHGMLAERYLDNLSRETKKGLREKAKQGLWVGGICPYGYLRADKDTITPANDASTDAVKTIFTLYETKMYSYARLADAMNERSDYWGRRFGVEAVRDIIQNRAYCGYVSSGGAEYPGKHAPIISEEQWQRCAAIRNARATIKWTAENPRPATNPSSLLIGIGACGCCDQPLWTSMSGNPTSRNGYYRCAGSSRRNCDARLQRITVVDEQIIGLISGLSLATAWYEKGIERIIQQSGVAIMPPPPGIDQAGIQAKIDRLTSAWVDGNISDAAYERQLVTLKTKLQQPPPPPPQTIDVAKAMTLLADLPALIQAATIEERRMLVQMLFKRVWIQDRAVKAISAYPMFAALIQSLERCEAGSQCPFPAPLTPFGDLWRSIPLWSSYAIVMPSCIPPLKQGTFL